MLNSRYEDLLVSGFTSLCGLEGDRRNTCVEHSPMLSDKSHQLQASLKLKIAGGGKSAQRKIYILVLYLLSLAICVRLLVLLGCSFVFPGQNCHKLCIHAQCMHKLCIHDSLQFTELQRLAKRERARLRPTLGKLISGLL